MLGPRLPPVVLPNQGHSLRGCGPVWHPGPASGRGAHARAGEAVSRCQASSSTLGKACPGRSVAPHLCARGPFPVPEPLPALVLATIDAIVLVSWGRTTGGVIRLEYVGGEAAISPREHRQTQAHTGKQPCAPEELLQWPGAPQAQTSLQKSPSRHPQPCENLSRPPSLASMAERMLLKMCHRYCRDGSDWNSMKGKKGFGGEILHLSGLIVATLSNQSQLLHC